MEKSKRLKFPDRIAGNENGQFDGEKMTALVAGRYEIRLCLQIRGGSGAYNYYVIMNQSGSYIHHFRASGTRDLDEDDDSRYISTEVDLEKDQTIYFTISYMHDSPVSYSSQSFMEGKLIKLK